MLKTGLFTLDWASVLDAVLMAIIFAVLGGLVTMVSIGGFDVFTANWVLIGHNMVNLGFTAGILSLGKDLLSTSTGSLLGATAPYVTAVVSPAGGSTQ